MHAGQDYPLKVIDSGTWTFPKIMTSHPVFIPLVAELLLRCSFNRITTHAYLCNQLIVFEAFIILEVSQAPRNSDLPLHKLFKVPSYGYGVWITYFLNHGWPVQWSLEQKKNRYLMGSGAHLFISGGNFFSLYLVWRHSVVKAFMASIS